MEASVGWFIVQAALMFPAWALGYRLGRGPRYRAAGAALLGLGGLLLWAWLLHHPSVSLRIIPASVMRYLEGTAAAPIFMAVIGVATACGRRPSQKRMAGLASCLALVYFLYGGMWMLQSTPQVGLAETIERDTLVLQSQNFTCVPAACATALNLIGLPTSEAQMVHLTETRWGRGATLIRALNGVNHRLEQFPSLRIVAQVCEPTYEQLQVVSLPAVTPVRFEATQHHMVVLTDIGLQGAWVADPGEGMLFMSHEELQGAYTGKVVTFRTLDR